MTVTGVTLQRITASLFVVQAIEAYVKTQTPVGYSAERLQAVVDNTVRVYCATLLEVKP